MPYPCKVALLSR